MTKDSRRRRVDDSEVMALLCQPPKDGEQDSRERELVGAAHDIGYEEGRRMDGETVICCDCLKIGVPSCDRDGHGLVMLADLIDTYSNPHRDVFCSALERIARGPNYEPYSEPWSRAEALIGLGRTRA